MYDLLGIFFSFRSYILYCIISPLILLVTSSLFQLFIIIIIKMSDMLGYCCLIYIYIYMFVYIYVCTELKSYFSVRLSSFRLLPYYYILYVCTALCPIYSLSSSTFSAEPSLLFLQLLMFLFSSCKYH